MAELISPETNEQLSSFFENVPDKPSLKAFARIATGSDAGLILKQHSLRRSGVSITPVGYLPFVDSALCHYSANITVLYLS